MLQQITVKEGTDRIPKSFNYKDKEYKVLSGQFEYLKDIGRMRLIPCRCKIQARNNIVTGYLFMNGDTWYINKKANK